MAVVRYTSLERERQGVASTFLAERIQVHTGLRSVMQCCTISAGLALTTHWLWRHVTHLILDFEYTCRIQDLEGQFEWSMHCRLGRSFQSISARTPTSDCLLICPFQSLWLVQAQGLHPSGNHALFSWSLHTNALAGSTRQSSQEAG